MMIDLYFRIPASKYLLFDLTFIRSSPLTLLRAIRGRAFNAMLPLVSLILTVMLASPANSQLAPEASEIGGTDAISSVVVSDHTDIEKEPGAAQPGALLSLEETLRRQLAAARAELAKQAEALQEQQRTEEALARSLETAQRVIENLKVAASLWDSAEEAPPKAGLSVQTTQTSTKQAIDDERRKVEALQQELSTARQTIDALKKDADLAAVAQAKAVRDRQVAEATSQQAGKALELERKRANSAERELGIVRQQRDALKENSIELSAALGQERKMAAGLARSLSAARETIDTIKDKRRTAAAERTLKARTPAGGPASASSGSGVQPVGKPRSQKKQKVKYRKSSQPQVLATELPAPLLPTRPPN